MPFRWLHLSDIHIGRPDNVQSVALRELIGEVTRQLTCEVDAVIFTGDLANSNEKTEYELFAKDLLRLLRGIRSHLASKARFIAVTWES